MKWIKKVSSTPLTAIAKVIDSLLEQTNDRQNAPSIHATREGIGALREDMNAADANLLARINNVNSDLSSDIAGVRSDLTDETNARIGDVRDLNSAVGGLSLGLAEYNSEHTAAESALEEEIEGVQSELTTKTQNLTLAIGMVWQTIYPVGSIYITTRNVSPADLFGGTWQEIKGRFLLGESTNYPAGTTGGSNQIIFSSSGVIGEHALTVPELPKHIHLYSPYYPRDAGIMAEYYSVKSGSDVQIPKMGKNAADYTDWTIDNLLYAGTQNPDKTQYAQGLGHSHSFSGDSQLVQAMPPYKSVYIWERTA